MKNKLKIIVALFVLSIFWGQCQFPHVDNSPNGAFGTEKDYDDGDFKIDLLDEWTSIDAIWQFKDGGELTIQSQQETINAEFIAFENTLEIIIDGKSIVYKVDVLSENSIKLISATSEIFLEK